MGDLGLYLAGAGGRPHYDAVARLAARPTTVSAATSSSGCGSSGPLASRDIPDTSAVPWASTGWTNNRNVTRCSSS